MIRKFSIGFSAPLQGFRLLAHSGKLIGFAIIPAIINIAIVCLAVMFSVKHFADLLHLFVDTPEIWYQYLLYYFLSIILAVALITLIILIAVIAYSIIASPFNDILSEKTEDILLNNKTDKPFSIRQALQDAWASILIEFKKLLVILPLIIVSFFLNFIPGLSVLSVVITCLILSFEFIDYSFSRKQMSFNQRFIFLKSNLFAMLGFGCALTILLAIPFVNFITLPVAVIGGSALFVKLKELR